MVFGLGFLVGFCWVFFPYFSFHFYYVHPNSLTPSAWASWARWAGEQAQSIICPVGILQGLWVLLMRPSCCCPQVWCSELNPSARHSYPGQRVWISCDAEMWNRQLGGEQVTHTADETALDQQWYSYNLKALSLPQTSFLLPCPCEEKAIWFYIWISGTNKNVACTPRPAPFSSSTDSLFSCKVGLYLHWECSWKDRSNNICEFVQVMLKVWPDLSKSFTQTLLRVLPGKHLVVKPHWEELFQTFLKSFSCASGFNVDHLNTSGLHIFHHILLPPSS